MQDGRLPLSTKELQDKVVEQQTGVQPIRESNINIPSISGGANMMSALTPEEMQQVSFPDRDSVLGDIFGRTRQGDSSFSRTYTEEAAWAGLGRSRYDAGYYPGMDMENARAMRQSGFAKIGSGLVKGGITAASTALETTLGTVFGLGSALYSLGSQLIDSEEGIKVGQALNKGVNNRLSTELIKLQQLSEEWFPNYRTTEEQTEKYQREWWKHMGTANFIGDSFLKNFGFTVGAMAGGAVWTAGMNKILRKRLANDILKSSLLASEGDAEVKAILGDVVDAVRSGSLEAIDPAKLAVSIENAARAVNKADAILQVTGSVIGAMGEGTMEGLMARDEFLEDYLVGYERDYQADYNNLEQTILDEGNPEFVDENGVYIMPDGSTVTRPMLKPEGYEELRRRQVKMAGDRQKVMEEARRQGDNLASVTFLLNLPILTTSNLIQFGRMFSGGWKTARKSASKVASKGITSKNIKTPKGYVAPVLDAEYKGIGNKVIRGALNSLKVAGSEAFEEMAQGTASSGTKAVADARLASFINTGYDPDAIGSFSDWFGSHMMQGASDYLGDIKNWQEGALGAITGLFGIPGRVWQKGNRWHGGIYQALKDAGREVNASNNAAATLNNLVNSKEFQDRWHSYIRHLAYDDKMQAAVEDGDQYAWHDANDAQLISDVMAFAKAGRLDDLLQIADVYGSMSVANARALQDALKDENDIQFSPENDIRNMSPQDVVERVKDQADAIKNTINQYKDVYDSLVARLPLNVEPDAIDEMLFTALQIKKYEQRFFTMLDETIKSVAPVLRAQSIFKRQVPGQETQVARNPEEQATRLEELNTYFAKLYSDVVLPVHMSDEVVKEFERGLDGLEAAAKGDKEAEKKLEDMRKLMESRRAFYKKLVYLQTDAGQRAHSEQKMTQEKLDDAADAEMSKIETNELNTLDDVKRAYRDKKDIPSRSTFIRDLRKVQDSNKAADTFLRIYDASQRFDDYVSSAGWANPTLEGAGAMFIPESEIRNIAGLDKSYLARMAHEAANRANSSQEFMDLPDSVIMSRDEFYDLVSGGPNAADPNKYPQYVSALRNTMSRYRGIQASTSPVDNMNPQPAPKQSPVPQSQGTDPAPSASSIWIPAGVDLSSFKASEPEQVPPQDIEAPISEKENTSPVADNPTPAESTAQQDMSDTFIKKTEVSNENVDGQRAYGQTGVPEIDSFEAEAVKSGEKAKAEADLGDFYRPAVVDDAGNIITPEHNPGYKDTWSALKNAGAFDTAAVEVEVGDTIEYGIDPNFPPYNGEPQILLYLNKNGERKLAGTMKSNTATTKYLGVRELKDAIMSEYRSRGDYSTPFYFSKKTTVWAKQPGQIVYGKEKSIRDAGYSEDNNYGALIYVDKDGNRKVVRGNKDANAKIIAGALASDVFRRGALYYLADNGQKEYVPIRLFVEHFNKETMESDKPVFQDIRSVFESMFKKVKALGNEDADIKKLQKDFYGDVGKLSKLLDLHKIDINIADFGGDIGKAMHIVYFEHVDGENDKKHHFYRRPDQISVPWIMNAIAELDPALQLKQDEEGNITTDIDTLINGDHITTNAELLRAKGVDFYTEPWQYNSDEKQWGFYPATDAQMRAQAQRDNDAVSREVKEGDDSVVADEVPETPEEMPEFDYPEGEDPVDNLEKSEDVPLKYDDLTDSQKEALKAIGLTPEEYDPNNSFIRDEILACS